MKYRLTVKGQVAIATVLLVVAFTAGSLGSIMNRENPQKPADAASGTASPSVEPSQAASSTEGTSAADTSKLEKVTVVEESDRIAANIYFNPDQWEIKGNEIQKINDIMDKLSKYPQTKIVIEGNINGIQSDGDTEFGTELSLKRAQVVSQVLMGKGIEESRIIVKSNGSSKPASSKPDEAWMNRRTQISFEE